MRDGSRMELAVIDRRKNGKAWLAACNVGDADWIDQADAEIGSELLQKARVSVVLGAGDYSLQLVETPNVPGDEMHDAVRWRIQHLIEYPIEEASIETFEMPAHANPGNKPMLYAVVAHQSDILSYAERMQEVSLHMDVIDIPELCLRNVAVMLPQDQNGVAFLHFTDDCGYLTITRRGVLYMIRRIETRRSQLGDAADDEFEAAERAAGVALEVQRSLDYYESHYDCRPVTELVLGPGENLSTLAASLSDNLGITVSRLDLDDLFAIEREIPAAVQSDCLLAIGAALRSETSTNVEVA